jgi:hypothetical protein
LDEVTLSVIGTTLTKRVPDGIEQRTLRAVIKALG